MDEEFISDELVDEEDTDVASNPTAPGHLPVAGEVVAEDDQIPFNPNEI